MSRSYKKNPAYSQTTGKRNMKRTKKYKRMASKAVRRNPEIPTKGKGYKKAFDSWNIYDGPSRRYSKQEFIKDWEKEEKEIMNGIYNQNELPYHKSFEENLLDWRKAVEFK